MEDSEQKKEVNETVSAESAAASSKTKSSTPWVAYLVACIALVAIAAGVVYLMEKDGRLSTGIFVPNGEISPNATIATVNGTKIKGSELNTSISQINISASQQGYNTEDPAVQENIKNQAVEMLINTELLKQEAANRGMVITDEDVTARIDALVVEVGGAEALEERMTSLGINDETLRRDVKTELTIQKLLDEVFATATIEVTAEEVEEVYESAGGEEAGLEPLETVYEQIENQVRTGKEQSILNDFLAELRAGASVEVSE